MAIKITYADGREEIVPQAVTVDYNYHEDSFDFCDEKGQPWLQLRMSEEVTWKVLEEPKPKEK